MIPIIDQVGEVKGMAQAAGHWKRVKTPKAISPNGLKETGHGMGLQLL